VTEHPADVASRPALVDVLTAAQRRLARGLAVALAEEGRTLDEWRLLRALADGEGHQMGELAETLVIPHPTLTRLVDGLVDSSLVYRRQSRADRRRVAVFLGRRGEQRLARLDAVAAGHELAVRQSPHWADIAAALRTAVL
jgi:DNA-binding MarR family transcriptional regulator